MKLILKEKKSQPHNQTCPGRFGHTLHSAEGQGRTMLIWRKFQACPHSRSSVILALAASWNSSHSWWCLSTLSLKFGLFTVLICTWLLWWDASALGFVCLLIALNSVSPTNFHQQAVQGWLLLDSSPAANPLLQACTESKNESNTPKATSSLPSCCCLFI